MITYKNHIENLAEDHVKGFFVGWPNPPKEATFIKILSESKYIWLAFDEERLVGFINCISDGILSAYIPLLEVLPEYQKKGIGSVLVDKMLETLKNHYMIDLSCDDDKIAFYENKGFFKANCMVMRNYEKQPGV